MVNEWDLFRMHVNQQGRGQPGRRIVKLQTGKWAMCIEVKKERT